MLGTTTSTRIFDIFTATIAQHQSLNLYYHNFKLDTRFKMKNTHNYTIIKQVQNLQLVQRRNEKKKWFEIVLDPFYDGFDGRTLDKYFKPNQAVSSPYTWRWKFKTQVAAQKKFTWLLMILPSRIETINDY